MRAQIQCIFAEVITDLRGTWKQLIATDVAFKVVYFLFLVPISGLVLKGFLVTQGTTVIADKEDQVRALEVAGYIGIMLAGAFPMVYLIRKYLAKPVRRIGKPYVGPI